MFRNLFDKIASIGSKFLKSTDRGYEVLSRYAWQLGSICDLIKHTHLVVIAKLEAIDQAQTFQDAEDIAHELSGQSLADSFRTSGLCDIFQGYGRSLRDMVGRLPISADPQSASPITGEEQKQWKAFCTSLVEREDAVAELYIDQIQGLQTLALTSSHQDLDQIKDHARQMKAILTDQVADFDSLAARFRQRIKV
jgi:hypothetical protein